jgi:hypothetical protein
LDGSFARKTCLESQSSIVASLMITQTSSGDAEEPKPVIGRVGYPIEATPSNSENLGYDVADVARLRAPDDVGGDVAVERIVKTLK